MVQKEPSGSAKPRGRPRGYDPATVLGQARDAFWRNGFSATSLDDLSAATGLNRPSLYGAFGDKRALYLATLQRSRLEMLASLELGLSTPGSLREVLLAVFAGASAIYRSGAEAQRGCFLIGTAVTESVADPEVRHLLDQVFGELDGAFAARLAAGLDELPPGADPKALGRIATAILHTLAVRARTGADEASLRAIYEAGVDLICGRP
ncbi:TetR/AcrR family transcriptional regulator [Phenylobacterium sp. LH3H17]|uniref:TetR/AcrR family transcriptional regulator n=1 Tax=Phenylobacterium sp. LH3H17 TaxID=2903901 RepID=UPI0020C953FD|nr:TetR/AcrR family transcriptional regulator [Phenylobacterium sp. LH3H17]UTP39582.1 TetR/AcrR family transcriptional regulator [Phenylobacterium sp. LH3H17]